MKTTNIYAIVFKDKSKKYIEANGTISYNFETLKFTYELNGKVIVLYNVVSYKLIGNDELSVKSYERCMEQAHIQRMLDKLQGIKDEIENDYDQDDIGYELGKIIDQIEEKVMPHDYMDDH